MNIFEAYGTCIKKYAVFSGRARRKEYWLFVLCNLLISMAIFALSFFGITKQMPTFVTVLYYISMAYSLFMLLPGLSAAVRRLHDVGHSGAFIFISLIPMVGGIILLVNLCKDSAAGENQYGPNPKFDLPPFTGADEENGLDSYDVSDGLSRTREVTMETAPVGLETVNVTKKLIVKCTRGPIVGTSAMGEVIYVGRDAQLCQLVFPPDTPGVSKVHCMLHTDGYSMEALDLGSHFGTFLENGTRLEAQKIVNLTNGSPSNPDSGSKSTLYLGSNNIAIEVELF